MSPPAFELGDVNANCPPDFVML